jgi:hypothetical protein
MVSHRDCVLNNKEAPISSILYAHVCMNGILPFTLGTVLVVASIAEVNDNAEARRPSWSEWRNMVVVCCLRFCETRIDGGGDQRFFLCYSDPRLQKQTHGYRSCMDGHRKLPGDDS